MTYLTYISGGDVEEYPPRYEGRELYVATARGVASKVTMPLALGGKRPALSIMRARSFLYSRPLLTQPREYSKVHPGWRC